MKPIEFPEQTDVIAKDQPEYLPLPAYQGAEHGEIITCWELTDEELEDLKKTKKLWLSMWTFGYPLQPVMLSVDKNGVVPRVGRCRVCGCTDGDCSGCIERTGNACHWVEPDLCSACAEGIGEGMRAET